jgi:hypothetical protein
MDSGAPLAVAKFRSSLGDSRISRLSEDALESPIERQDMDEGNELFFRILSEQVLDRFDLVLPHSQQRFHRMTTSTTYLKALLFIRPRTYSDVAMNAHKSSFVKQCVRLADDSHHIIPTPLYDPSRQRRDIDRWLDSSSYRLLFQQNAWNNLGQIC